MQDTQADNEGHHAGYAGLSIFLNGALPGPYVPVRVTRTSVHFCTASLQNLAVQQDFYSLLDVPLERFC